MYRAPLLVVLASAALLPLTSCAPVSGDAQAAHARLTEAAELTERAAGGDWLNEDDPVGRRCDILPFISGVAYPALRVGDPPGDLASAVDAVLDTWTGLGYRVESTVVGDVTQLRATFGGALLVFRVSDQAMTLHGESECRPE